jgi:hypothetical protein
VFGEVFNVLNIANLTGYVDNLLAARGRFNGGRGFRSEDEALQERAERRSRPAA